MESDYDIIPLEMELLVFRNNLCSSLGSKSLFLLIFSIFFVPVPYSLSLLSSSSSSISYVSPSATIVSNFFTILVFGNNLTRLWLSHMKYSLVFLHYSLPCYLLWSHLCRTVSYVWSSCTLYIADGCHLQPSC